MVRTRAEAASYTFTVTDHIGTRWESDLAAVGLVGKVKVPVENRPIMAVCIRSRKAVGRLHFPHARRRRAPNTSIIGSVTVNFKRKRLHCLKGKKDGPFASSLLKFFQVARHYIIHSRVLIAFHSLRIECVLFKFNWVSLIGYIQRGVYFKILQESLNVQLEFVCRELGEAVAQEDQL